MAGTSRQRLDEIEHDLLSDAPLAECLRKCVALGLALNSDVLCDWATRELEGYQRVEDVPAYRRVPVNMVADITSVVGHLLYDQPIPSAKLPAPFRNMISAGGYPLTDGVAGIRSLIEQSHRSGGFIAMTFPDSERLAVLLTQANLRRGARYELVRYKINVSGLHDVLGRVRTKAIHVLSDIRNLADESRQPSPKGTDQAVNVVVYGGEHHRINVATNRTDQGNITNTFAASVASDDHTAVDALRWTKRQAYWTIVGVFVTILIAVITLLFV